MRGFLALLLLLAFALFGLALVRFVNVRQELRRRMADAAYRRRLQETYGRRPFRGTVADVLALVAELVDVDVDDVRLERPEPGRLRAWVPRSVGRRRCERAARELRAWLPPYVEATVEREP